MIKACFYDPLINRSCAELGISSVGPYLPRPSPVTMKLRRISANIKKPLPPASDTKGLSKNN